MIERPILMSAPMVRATLGGTKTQTRREVKPQPVHAQVHEWAGRTVWDAESRTWCWRDVVLGGDLWDARNGTARTALAERSPYGQPGDRLWVRETYALHHAWDGHPPTAGGSASKRVWHRADAPNAIDGRGRWRPSIHMPRWASRITLEVTSVRVERLQDITEADARAEGVDALGGRAGVSDARGAFCALWASINGPESWDANPWVWVVGFKRGGGA